MPTLHITLRLNITNENAIRLAMNNLLKASEISSISADVSEEQHYDDVPPSPIEDSAAHANVC